jgi:hypothetical protein
MLAAVSFNPLWSMSVIATGLPWPASRRARLRPMPDAAPLITAVRPLMVRLALVNVAPQCSRASVTSGVINDHVK